MATGTNSGKAAENVIAATLDQRGFTYERQFEIGSGIYDSPTRVDFFVHDVPGFGGGLILESKWQDTSGTADEKLPFLVANIKERYPCPTIVVLHGGGYRKGAEHWLRRQVGGSLFAVMGLEELVSFVMRVR